MLQPKHWCPALHDTFRAHLFHKVNFLAYHYYMMCLFFLSFVYAHSCWHTIMFLLYSTRVSNELGAGQPQSAKLATKVVMYMALSEGLVISLTMTLLRNVWGYMYSNEKEIVTYIAKMLPVLGISFFIDGLHSSLSGGFSNQLIFGSKFAE